MSGTEAAGRPLLLLTDIRRRTSCGTPSRPRSPSVSPLSPRISAATARARSRRRRPTTSRTRSAPWRATRSRLMSAARLRALLRLRPRPRGASRYRLALDEPERVDRLAVLDIVPTGDVFRRADMEFGLAYWHWFFLAQPDGLPERLIGADPDAFYFRQRYQARDLFDAEALDDYLRCCPPSRRRSTPCARTTAPARRSTTRSTRSTAAPRGSHAPCSCSGAGAASFPSCTTTCSRSGADGRATSADGRSTAATYLAEEAPSETLGELLSFFE